MLSKHLSFGSLKYGNSRNFKHLRILDVVYCTHPAIRSLDPKREEMCSCCDGHLWECGCWSCWSILMLLMLKKGRNSSFLPFFYAKRWSRKQKTSVNWGSWLGMGQRSGILLIWNLARKLPWAHPNKKPRVIWSWQLAAGWMFIPARDLTSKENHWAQIIPEI
jgi:hypothetical protein